MSNVVLHIAQPSRAVEITLRFYVKLSPLSDSYDVDHRCASWRVVARTGAQDHRHRAPRITADI